MYRILDVNKTSDVWCPTTSNGLWIARHPTGFDFITGNSAPNLAQIPAIEEFRKLFNAPEGWKFVGADLANIELRVLAHYLAPYDDGKYADAVISKDMHWYHAGLAGFINNDGIEYDESIAKHKAARNLSKKFVFGWFK